MSAPEKCPNCNTGGKSNEWQPSRRWYYQCGTYVYADEDGLKVAHVGDLCYARMCANELRKELNSAREALREIAQMDTSQDASPQQCSAVMIAMNALEAAK